MITSRLNHQRQQVIMRLLNGEQMEVPISTRISLEQLAGIGSDEAFYSLLVQTGYLALLERVKNKPNTAIVFIPNIELATVWREFILENFYSGEARIRTLFDRADDLVAFAENCVK